MKRGRWLIAITLVGLMIVPVAPSLAYFYYPTYYGGPYHPQYDYHIHYHYHFPGYYPSSGLVAYPNYEGMAVYPSSYVPHYAYPDDYYDGRRCAITEYGTTICW